MGSTVTQLSSIVRHLLTRWMLQLWDISKRGSTHRHKILTLLHLLRFRIPLCLSLTVAPFEASRDLSKLHFEQNRTVRNLNNVRYGVSMAVYQTVPYRPAYCTTNLLNVCTLLIEIVTNCLKYRSARMWQGAVWQVDSAKSLVSIWQTTGYHIAKNCPLSFYRNFVNRSTRHIEECYKGCSLSWQINRYVR
jgi:hypothetical protein